jgi:hypothetical protein
MGTELVPETLYSNELTRLCAREDYIEPTRCACCAWILQILYETMESAVVLIGLGAYE